MIKEERQKYLMDLLSQYKFLKVRDIVNELKITDMTVRRDFQELEDKGLIIRVHGGARIIEDNISISMKNWRLQRSLLRIYSKTRLFFWVQVQPSNWSMSF